VANNKRGFLKALGFICLGIFMATFIFTLATHQGFKDIIKSFYSKYKSPSNYSIAKTSDKLFNKEWFYNYGDIKVSDDYYPIVHLRSGHKIIRKSGDSLLVGWQYELINTAEKNYLVKITYQIILVQISFIKNTSRIKV